MLVTVICMGMFLTVELTAMCVFMGSMDVCAGGGGCLMSYLAGPGAGVLAALVLVALQIQLSRRVRPRILIPIVGIPVLVFTVLHFLGIGASGLLVLVAGGAILDGLLLRRRHSLRLPAAAALAAGWTALVVVLLSIHSLGFVETNRFGLVSGPPGGVGVETYEEQIAQGTKDPDYPTCRFEYNSLGYRDVEPDMGRSQRGRILLVGDSYVWGDGIPTLEGTLGAALRRELEERAPGRYEVMAAGWPGNGLWGYRRTAAALTPVWRPAVVVVLCLGESDFAPVDPQRIVDALPAWGPARNLFENLGLARRVHRAAQAHWMTAGVQVDQELVEESISGLLHAVQGSDAQLLVLDFSGGTCRSSALEAAHRMEVPEDLRYPGRSSDLWYARDSHPKPALNLRIASLLANRLQTIPGLTIEP